MQVLAEAISAAEVDAAIAPPLFRPAETSGRFAITAYSSIHTWYQYYIIPNDCRELSLILILCEFFLSGLELQ